MSFGSSHGIIPALDSDTVYDVLRTVEASTGIPGVVGYKIGLTMALRLGLPGAVAALREVTDLPIIYDHQKAGPDIPDMGHKFCKLAAEAGVSGLVIFPLAGPRAVDAFVGGSISAGLLPLVGGDLPLKDYNASGGGYVVDDVLDQIFQCAADLGADHFIVPGNTTEKISHHARWLKNATGTPSLVIPGIGALGGNIPDCFAAANGCNAYAVIGRGVYEASNPGEAARKFGGEALGFA
ncbi:MAG: orotidine 5'-phosphate decarboxylase / HUMPS family protein [Pseudomonadota bacterium]|nr:orotidine 5'-phosphate decarboxylase / HUMPS family protein [Pseudomonadota bacterium]